MKKYFIHNSNEQQGPFDIDELKELSLRPDTPVWYEGLEQWTIIANVPELTEIIKKQSPPPFTTTPKPQAPPALTHALGGQNEIIGIYKNLQQGETLEVENPTVSLVNFEKGSFFKSYDTCIGKVYLTNKRLLILKLIVLEAKNMKVASEEQFGSALGQWFDISLEHITNVSTPRQGFFRSLFSSLIGEKKEGLEIKYESPMETEKKSLLFGTKKVRENFIIVFTIDNKDLWNMKVQTSITKAKTS